MTTGTPPFGSFGGGPDVIDLANFNAHFTVPVFNKEGRGMPFNYGLAYDTSTWYPVTSGSTTSWQPVNWGWGVQTQLTTGYVSFTETSFTGRQQVGSFGGFKDTYSELVFMTGPEHTHQFSGSTFVWSGTCGTANGSLNALTADGSGYAFAATGHRDVDNYIPAGKLLNPPFNLSVSRSKFTDTNGNQISVNSSGVFTDTLGNTASPSRGRYPLQPDHIYLHCSVGSKRSLHDEIHKLHGTDEFRMQRNR